MARDNGWKPQNCRAERRHPRAFRPYVCPRSPGAVADLAHTQPLHRPLTTLACAPETTAAKVRLLTAAAHYFNTLAVADFGGRPGAPREEGLVEQVVGAAF